ncbi:hypothetical protein [Thioclava sp.]|uniref:hypothetical protein n=1 Tax=Thioclava sp. TaxID=1933450 RepID=UPI003AA851E1
MNKAEIKPSKTGISISFPIEFKAIFKQHFPRAKWDAEARVWRVTKRATEHLKQFEESVNKAIDIRLEREERILAADELETLQSQLNDVDQDTISCKKAVDDLSAARDEIKAARYQLEKKKDGFEAIRAARSAAADDVQKQRDAVHQIVSAIVDIAEIETAIGAMRKFMKIPKAYASARYMEAEERLREIDSGLREVVSPVRRFRPH